MKFLLYCLAALTASISLAQTPCIGNVAGGFPCDGYTLQSQLTIAQMGGVSYGGSDPAEAQDSWGWTDPLDGKEYAIIAMNDRTAFVDISDPNNPLFLGSLLSETSTSWWRDVKVYNNHAYIVSDDNGNHGMQIFDLTKLRSVVSPPVTFSEDGWKTWGTGGGRGRAHNIVINEANGFAYVVGTSGYASSGVVIFDLSNPTNPTEVSAISALGYCHDAQVITYNGPDTDYQGSELLIGTFTNSDRVYILDITDRNNPVTVSFVDYPNRRYTHQGWFTEDQRFFIVGDEQDETSIGTNTKTFVFDLSDLENPVLHHTYVGPTEAIDHNGYVVGNRFYLASYRAGMRVMKIDELYDPTPNMSEVGYFDSHPGSNAANYNGAWNVYPFFESGNILISDLDEGLLIVKDPNFDNTDPVANCQNYTATLDPATATVTIDATDLDNGSTDNIGIVNRTLTGQTTFTCDDVGQTFNVTLMVEDDYGNTDTCVAQVTVAGSDTNWSAGSWSDGAPQPGSNAVIVSNYDMNSRASIDACTCEVNSGATLTVAAGKYLKTEQDIDVASGASLIVEHQGSLVQEDDNASVTNNGTINVDITTPNLSSRDFMVMGSPMTGETRTDVWNSAFLVLDHTTANFVPHPDVEAQFPGADNWADNDYDNWNAYTGAITPGEGYIVRPQTGFGQPGGTFYYTHDTGTLNNGEVSFPVVYNGTQNGSPNVVANPYPSAITASGFIAANSMVDAVYFWEHLQPPSTTIPGAGSMNFSMENISMHNGVGGTAATITQGVNTGATATPNNYISTAQGFAFKASAGGTAVFNNTMRVTDNNNTLRTPDGKDRIWIAIGNAEHNLYRTALIGFMEEATAGHDPSYDANRLATVLSIYSHLEDGSQQFGIQGREVFESGMKVPMGFSSLIDETTTYKISIDNLEGANLEGATVYLKDHDDPYADLHNLSSAPYTFESGKGTYHNRFTILFLGQPILDTNDPLERSISVFPNPARSFVNIYSPTAKIESIELYDLLGKRMESELKIPSTSTMVDLKTIETGMYFLHIKTDSGTITKKILRQ